MFRAIGIGFSRSLPAAAALNWVFKDGLGRLSRCIYTASLPSAFGTNLKACYIRKALLISKWETMVDAGDALDSAPKEWSKSVEECKRRAQGNMNVLTEQIVTLGWAAKNTLLSARTDSVQFCR